jgi:hypothetical protein
MNGRSAGSPDNAQGTHFFMINDSGTYFLRKPPPPEISSEITADLLIERARQAKVRLLANRIDVPASRAFPAYLDSNRFLSNLPGTTIFLPVVDLSHQYINGLMYLLTEPDGARPTLVDDRNFYRPAGVEKWVRNGFLNDNIKVPLGVIATLRTQIEADLLVQNLMLLAEAMGLEHGSMRRSVRRYCSAIRNSGISMDPCWVSSLSLPRSSCWIFCAGKCRCRNMPSCARIRSA